MKRKPPVSAIDTGKRFSVSPEIFPTMKGITRSREWLTRHESKKAEGEEGDYGISQGIVVARHEAKLFDHHDVNPDLLVLSESFSDEDSVIVLNPSRLD